MADAPSPAPATAAPAVAAAPRRWRPLRGLAFSFSTYLLGLASVVVLARCVRLLGAPRWAQYATCLVYAAFARIVLYDVYWFTESFCTSAMIFGTHGWLAHRRTGSRAALVWSGAWLAWAVSCDLFSWSGWRRSQQGSW